MRSPGDMLGLDQHLIQLIKSGKLLNAIEDAYKFIDSFNTAIDAWEQRNPDAAKLVPWHDAREQWKKDGRPRPPWYHALHVTRGKTRCAPIGASVLVNRFGTNWTEWYKKTRNDPVKLAALRERLNNNTKRYYQRQKDRLRNDE